MSAPKYFFPMNQLAIALRSAPPRSAAECLRAASANLLTIAADCRREVDVRLERLGKCCSASSDPPSDQDLQEIYDLTLQLIGVSSAAGLPDLDAAASSLCDVVDGMITRHEARLEPIAVHFSTMRLLRTISDTGVDPGPVLEGLQKVRQRFKHMGASD